MTELHNTSGAARRELISFRVGAQEYCVDIMSVREIRGWTPATQLPDSPSYVRGVINLRGAVLPVVDLSSRLGFGDAVPSVRHAVIVAQIGHRVVGLLVDGVSDILTVTDEMVQPTPDLSVAQRGGMVEGLMPMDGRMVSLINLDNLLPADLPAAA